MAGEHETLGLARVGGRDTESHQIDQDYEGGRALGAGTGHPQSQGIGVDPVSDDRAPHGTDVGWFSLEDKWSDVGAYRYPGPAGSGDGDGAGSDSQ